MTPTSVIARFAGIVTYTDDSWQQFAGHLDAEGNLSLNLPQSEGQEAVYQVQTDQTWLQDMMNQLCTISLTPTNPSGVDKTVRSMTAELSGRVSYDDNTWGDFIVQYTNLTGIIPATSDSIGHWTAAAEYSPTLASLISMFETVVGAGNAVIAAISLSPSFPSSSPSISLSPSISFSPSVSAFSPSVSAFSPSISLSPSPSISAFSPSISTLSPSISLSPSPSI